MVNLIVKFKTGNVTANTDLVNGLGAEILHVYDSINAISVSVSEDKIGLLKADPGVEYVEIDEEAHILGFPDEIAPEGQKKALAAEQMIPWGISKIRSPEVWDAGNKGAGIKGCIIDTGIDYNHPDLKDNYKGGYNAITKTNDPLDDNGHGSHVSGIAAARDNDIGVVGVAPEMDIYAVKALDLNGSGSYSNIIASIQWAIDNGMHLINMSLGGSSYSKALEDICIAAYNAGILIIAAAGNSGGDGSKDTVGYPAKYDSVVAVAATDSIDERASFSSVGPAVEVSAPGVSIPSTVPTSNAKYSDPSGYKSLSGTSMASPHAFGAAAVVKKSNPNLTNADIRKILADTSVDLGTPGRDVFYGSGRIDAKAAVDNNPQPPQPPVLTKITVSPASASVIIGATQQVKATAFDQYNKPMPSIEISWIVDNPEIGNVTPSSVITGPDGSALTTFTALAVGTSRVTASNGDVSGNIDITVTQTPPQPVLTKIAVSPATASVIVGRAQQFKATALDQNNNPMVSIDISWIVDVPEVGNVTPPSAITDQDGNAMTTFTALATGTAAVHALNGDITGRAIVTVTAPPADKKFTVQVLGVPSKPSGILVLRRTRGELTSDEACKFVCDALKKM